MKFNKGQITILVASITVGGTLLGSVIAAFVTSNNKVSSMNTKIEVVKTKEELHYKELVGDIAEMKNEMEKNHNEIKQLLKEK